VSFVPDNFAKQFKAIGAAPGGAAVLRGEPATASFRLIARPVEAEFGTSVTAKAHFVLADGQRELRRGRDPGRAIHRGIGFSTGKSRRPAIAARRRMLAFASSTTLPKRAGRRKSPDVPAPVLHLRAICAGDFPEAFGLLVPILTSRHADALDEE